jgi:hypothetical protein
MMRSCIMYRVYVYIDPQRQGKKKKAHLHYIIGCKLYNKRIDSNKLLHQNIIRPFSLLRPSSSRTRRDEGGRPSSGRPRFLPGRTASARPVAAFFFSVCACGCGSPVGIVVVAIAKADSATDTPNGLSKLALLNTGVAGCITPVTTPDMTPTDTQPLLFPQLLCM